MNMQAYDHKVSQWAIAALAHLDAARSNIIDGHDALGDVSAARACLRIEAGELPPDTDLLGILADDDD